MGNYQDFFKAKRTLDKKTKFKRPFRGANGRPKLLNGVYTLVIAVLAAGSVWFLSSSGTSLGPKAMNLLSKIDVSWITQTQAEEANSSPTKGAKEEKKSSDSAADAVVAPTSKRAWSDEEVNLFTKLEERKKALDAREANLNKLEEELQKQREELEKRLAHLEEVRGNIASKLENKVKADGEKVATLVSVYSNMKPAQAAKIIEGLDEDLAVEVLTKMKNKSAAEILNTMNSEKAKHLSEKFAGYRQPASN